MGKEKEYDEIFIFLSGRSALIELKIKLLLDRDGHNIKKNSCSKAKEIMYKKYSKYILPKDKQIIDEAVWTRNKLVHFEFPEILKKQKDIYSRVKGFSVDKNSVLESIENAYKGKNSPVNEKSSLFGQFLELGNNPERIRELDNILNKAIEIINRIIIKSAPK